MKEEKKTKFVVYVRERLYFLSTCLVTFASMGQFYQIIVEKRKFVVA